MATTVFLSVILAFVCGLVSLSLAKSFGPSADSNSNSRNVVIKNDDGEEFLLNPKEFMVYYTVMGLRDMSQGYVDNAANISVYLLKDNVLRSAAGKTIKEFNKNITEFVDQYKNLDELKELFNLVDVYSDTTSQYYEMAPGSATPDMLTIERKLREYDSDDLDKKFEADFEEFVEKFLVKFQEFKSKLTKAELESYRGLMEWSVKLKQLHSTIEKIALFGDFFKFLEE